MSDKDEYHTVGEDGVSKAKPRIIVERVFFEVKADGEVLHEYDDVESALECAYNPSENGLNVVGKCEVTQVTTYAPRRKRLY